VIKLDWIAIAIGAGRLTHVEEHALIAYMTNTIKDIAACDLKKKMIRTCAWYLPAASID